MTMEAIQSLRDGLTVAELLKGLGIAFVVGRFLPSFVETGSSIKKSSSYSSLRAEIVKLTGLFSLYLVARSWLALVDRYVPDPYLVSIELDRFSPYLSGS